MVIGIIIFLYEKEMGFMKRYSTRLQKALVFSWLFLLLAFSAAPVQAMAEGSGIPIQGAADDITAPELNSISLNKKTGASGDFIIITLDAEDDLSGVDDYYLMVSYTSPNQETEKYIYPNLDKDGLYRGMIPVEPEDETGTWKIISVRLDDLAGNTRKIYNSKLGASQRYVMDLSDGDYKVGYHVTFSSRGGSKVSSATAVGGTLIKAPASPVRSGYVFGGWYKEAGLVNRWNFNLDKVTQDITLYAKWIGAPSNFKAQSDGYDRIELTWWKPEGASQFKVYRAASSSGTYRYIGTTSSTFFIDKGLATGKTYYYKVRSFDPEYKISGPYSPIVKAKPVLSTPSGFTAVRSSSSKIRTSWNKVSGASGYEVWRSVSSGGTYSLRKSTSSLTYTNTGLTFGRTYYYKVRAYRLVGEKKIYSSWSPIKSAKLY